MYLAKINKKKIIVSLPDYMYKIINIYKHTCIKIYIFNVFKLLKIYFRRIFICFLIVYKF